MAQHNIFSFVGHPVKTLYSCKYYTYWYRLGQRKKKKEDEEEEEEEEEEKGK